MTTNTNLIITLDEHTAALFDPAYRSAPLQQYFHLSAEGLEDRLFAGRLAPLNVNWNSEWAQGPISSSVRTWVPVIREVDEQGNILDEPGRACLISIGGLKLDLGDVPSEDQIEEYWTTRFMGYDPTSTDSEDYSYVFHGYDTTIARCHFDRMTGTAVRMVWWGDCECLNQAQAKVDPRQTYTYISGSVGWMGATDLDDFDDDGLRAVADMSDEQFHTGLEVMLRFLQQGEEELCQSALGGSTTTRQLVQKRLEIEFLEALGSGGALEGYTAVHWKPWVVGEIEVYSPTTRYIRIDWPDALVAKCAAACLELGCHAPLADPARTPINDPMTQYAKRTWASQFKCEIKVESPSGREIIVQIAKLQAEMEVMQAEFAGSEPLSAADGDAVV